MKLLKNTLNLNTDNPLIELIDTPVTFTEPLRDQRVHIAERAYYKAEARGFQSGYEVEDWLNAEKELADNH